MKEGKAFDLNDILQSTQSVYDVLGIKIGSEEAYQLFHTRYHIIPEITVNSLNW